MNPSNDSTHVTVPEPNLQSPTPIPIQPPSTLPNRPTNLPDNPTVVPQQQPRLTGTYSWRRFKRNAPVVFVIAAIIFYVKFVHK
jgi:hypothetical protein